MSVAKLKFLLVLDLAALGAALDVQGAPVVEGPAAERGAKPQARADVYGDPLPPGAFARLGTLRWRHHHNTADLVVAFSPDGKTVVTGGNGTLKRWDVATGKLLAQFPGTYFGRVLSAPNGRWLVESSGDLLDATSGQVVRRLTAGGYPLAFAPDSSLLATSAENLVTVSSTASGQAQHQLRGHELQVYCGATTPDGRTLITLCWGRKVCHWDVATGKLRQTLTLPVSAGRTRELSPDGRTLALSHGEGVTLWDTTTAKERGSLGDEAVYA